MFICWLSVYFQPYWESNTIEYSRLILGIRDLGHGTFNVNSLDKHQYTACKIIDISRADSTDLETCNLYVCVLNMSHKGLYHNVIKLTNMPTKMAANMPTKVSTKMFFKIPTKMAIKKFPKTSTKMLPDTISEYVCVYCLFITLHAFMTIEDRHM